MSQHYNHNAYPDAYPNQNRPEQQSRSIPPPSQPYPHSNPIPIQNANGYPSIPHQSYSQQYYSHNGYYDPITNHRQQQQQQQQQQQPQPLPSPTYQHTQQYSQQSPIYHPQVVIPAPAQSYRYSQAPSPMQPYAQHYQQQPHRQYQTSPFTQPPYEYAPIQPAYQRSPLQQGTQNVAVVKDVSQQISSQNHPQQLETQQTWQAHMARKPSTSSNTSKPSTVTQSREIPSANRSKLPVNGVSTDAGSRVQVNVSQKPAVLGADSSATVDYKVLLLSLAQEYLDCAHSLGPRAVLLGQQEDIDNYYQLVATSLGCIEAVLKRGRMAPREEASLSLQYANLLHAETENTGMLDELLTKQIAKCDGAKIYDLKYSFQHLQIQAMFTTNPRAALKQLDRMIQDATSFRHVPWVYVFRFLRIQLSIASLDGNRDLIGAQKNARALLELAEVQVDHPVFVMAAALEGLLFLQAGTKDGFTQVQYAIAEARKYQGNLAQGYMQLWTFLDCIELACHVVFHKVDEAYQCGQRLHERLQRYKEEAGTWTEDGLLKLSIGNGYDIRLIKESNGLFTLQADGQVFVNLSWMSRSEIVGLGLFLKAVSYQLHSSCSGKVRDTLKEGLLWCSDENSTKDLEKPRGFPNSGSVKVLMNTLNHKRKLEINMQVQLCLLYCTVGRWIEAEECSRAINQLIATLDKPTASKLRVWQMYIRGTIEQGLGKLSEALKAFESPELALRQTAQARILSAEETLASLANLNALSIRHALTPSPRLNEQLLQVQAMIAHSPNAALRCAANLAEVNLLETSDNPQAARLMKQKNALKLALTLSKPRYNEQMTALTLIVMNALLFIGMTGEQAGKSFLGAFQQAEKVGNPLIRAVAHGHRLDLLDREGTRGAEVDKLQAGLERLMGAVPETVKASLYSEER